MDQYLSAAAIALNNLNELPQTWADIYNEISLAVPQMVDFLYRMYTILKAFAVVIVLMALAIAFILYKLNSLNKDINKVKELFIYDRENRL